MAHSATRQAALRIFEDYADFFADAEAPVDEEPRLGAAAFARLCADLPGLPAPLATRRR